MLSGFFFGLAESAVLFVTGLIFFVGSNIIRDEGVTVIPGIITVLTLLVFAITSVSGMLLYIPQTGASRDTASRLLRLADLGTTSHEHLGTMQIVSVGAIEFHDLRFAYPSRPEVIILRNISLCIRPGTSTAIVGGSGSGKSTIANLLLNLYCTSSPPAMVSDKAGDLTIGGRDIKNIYTPSLRALVVVVSQSPTIFASSVADNIIYGLATDSPYHRQHSIVDAAKAAGIHDFIISLPLAYDTLIGEGGTGISGGQAQRIVIAQALVRKPSVLILDEATSALDVESASLVRDTIKTLLKDRNFSVTVIIITHNREQMEIADHIVVLDHGIIVEEGDFQELLGRNGPLVNLLCGGEWDTGKLEEKVVREPRPGRAGGPFTDGMNRRRTSRSASQLT